MKKPVWYCADCNKQIPDEDVFADLRTSVGQYGGIVTATIYCDCGNKLAENVMVDNSGNIPPKS